MDVYPADPSSLELSAHHQLQNLVVRHTGGGGKPPEVRDDRLPPRTETAEYQLAQHRGLEEDLVVLQ